MMKKTLLVFSLLSCILVATAQNKSAEDQKISITFKEGKTEVINRNGVISVNVSPLDAKKIKAAGFIRYSDFGAKADGKTDDIDVIAATHAYANQQNIKVKADANATYYIGGQQRTAIIKTDTDFGNATFIIDDTDVENSNAAVFMVSSDLKSFKLNDITSLAKNQTKIAASLPSSCLISVTNSNVKQYIRFGLNQNNGSSQTDIFVVDKLGNVDMKAPIIWDFEQITEIKALPIDENLLKVTGGNFITIANKGEAKDSYFQRNMAVRRSHVLVDALKHSIQGEGENGAPYGGFINISDCAYVTVKNAIMTGHRTYTTIGSAGKPVSKGTYDILATRALNISFVNCSQTNDINDSKYWGIFASNFCKNIVLDKCTLSRFDAHQGVANATIRNSTLGHMGINAIGSGVLTVENSTILARNLVNLRSDYGSTWKGELIIRNCVFKPSNGKSARGVLINGFNDGGHDFGYTCYMPERIMIENLKIEDTNHPGNYEGPVLFADFNPKMKDRSYQEKYPYIKTKEVSLKNVKITSGKSLQLSDNSFMFKEVKVQNN